MLPMSVFFFIALYAVELVVFISFVFYKIYRAVVISVNNKIAA